MQFSLRTLLIGTTAVCCLLGIVGSLLGLMVLSLVLGVLSSIGLAFLPYALIRLFVTTNDFADKTGWHQAIWVPILCVSPVLMLLGTLFLIDVSAP